MTSPTYTEKSKPILSPNQSVEKVEKPAKAWRNKWQFFERTFCCEERRLLPPGIHWSLGIYPSKDIAETVAEAAIVFNKRNGVHFAYFGAFPVSDQ